MSAEAGKIYRQLFLRPPSEHWLVAHGQLSKASPARRHAPGKLSRRQSGRRVEQISAVHGYGEARHVGRGVRGQPIRSAARSALPVGIAARRHVDPGHDHSPHGGSAESARSSGHDGGFPLQTKQMPQFHSVLLTGWMVPGSRRAIPPFQSATSAPADRPASSRRRIPPTWRSTDRRPPPSPPEACPAPAGPLRTP